MRQEELNSLMSKDQPEKLGEKVQKLVKKLAFVRQVKESELSEAKMKERSKRETLAQEQSGNGLIGGRNNIAQLEDETSHYRERCHLEKQNAETKKKELDAMETKG